MKYIFKYLRLACIILIKWPAYILCYLLLELITILWYLNFKHHDPIDKTEFYISAWEFELQGTRYREKVYLTIKDYINGKYTWVNSKH